MAKLEPTDGFIIHGWMVTELHLGGYELVAYALVHQFSQKSKAGLYTGGVPYLAEWLRCTNETARKYLHILEKKGLIKSIRGRENGVPYCNYQVIDNQIPKILRDTPKNLRGDTLKIKGSTPKNLRVDNNSDNKDDNKFIPPTPAQVSAYAEALGFRCPEGFGHFYVGHYANNDWKNKNGKPILNWKNNIREVWMRNNNKDRDFSEYIPMQPSTKTTIQFAGL